MLRTPSLPAWDPASARVEEPSHLGARRGKKEKVGLVHAKTDLKTAVSENSLGRETAEAQAPSPYSC